MPHLTIRDPVPASTEGAETPLWATVDAIVARADRATDLEAHRLETVAFPLGLPADPQARTLLAVGARAQVVRQLAAPLVLRRVREALDGTLLLIKGLEVARLYPLPRMRPFNDIDLLVEDAERVQQRLIEAGFAEVGDEDKYAGIHHLRPLHWPGSPLLVEIHSRPKWPSGLRPPAFAELAAVAVPARVGVDGVSTLPREEHAVLLAVHGWAHEPLARLLDVIDVAVLLDGADRHAADAVARRWGVERLWRATVAARDALFADEPMPPVLRVWTRGLRLVRERTVFETHVARTLAPFATLPPTSAVSASLRSLGARARPDEGEPLSAKARRAVLAVRHAGRRRSDRGVD